MTRLLFLLVVGLLLWNDEAIVSKRFSVPCGDIIFRYNVHPFWQLRRSAMFGITVGILTEYWTGQSIPQQVETFAQLLGLLPLDYETYFQ